MTTSDREHACKDIWPIVTKRRKAVRRFIYGQAEYQLLAMMLEDLANHEAERGSEEMADAILQVMAYVCNVWVEKENDR